MRVKADSRFRAPNHKAHMLFFPKPLSSKSTVVCNFVAVASFSFNGAKHALSVIE